MARHWLPLLAVIAIFAPAGCGGDDDGGSQTQTRTVDEPCPEGTPELGVRDVLPKPPKGMVVLRIRKDQVERSRQAFAAGFGDKARSLKLAVVAPSGRQVGTGVGVLNLTVRADDDAPPETSQTRQPLTIAGRDGIIGVPPGGGPTKASGSVGKCGIVVLNGPDEASVRRVAAAIRQPE